MALAPVQLAPAGFVSSSVASVYTCPAATRACVKCITLYNQNTTTEVVEVYLTPDGDSSGQAANKVFPVSLISGAAVIIELPFPWVLAANDKIEMKTNTASKVVVTVSGTEE